MSLNVTISVISNSQLGSLGRVCFLAENHWGIKVDVILFSTLSFADLALPKRFIRSYRKLPKQPQANDYHALAAEEGFRKSACCLLFFTRLVPASIFSTVDTINFHPSLLPAHPGLSGFTSAIAAEQLAVTAHLVDSSMDGGKILRQYFITPFPHGASIAQLQRESSFLCSAAILSIIRSLPSIAIKKRQEFLSGEHCLDLILSDRATL